MKREEAIVSLVPAGKNMAAARNVTDLSQACENTSRMVFAYIMYPMPSAEHGTY